VQEVTALLRAVDDASKAVRSVSGQQIRSGPVKLALRNLATEYFSVARERIAHEGVDSSELDALFQELHRSSHINPSKQRCSDLMKSVRRGLVQLDGKTLSKSTRPPATTRSQTDLLIVATLNEVCPSAGLAYQQALLDLEATERFSWRGPATDLREALRETLDVLAPDEVVTAMPGFKLEKDARGPTMKQKVRYVLKSRDVPSGSIAAPEQAAQGVEDIVGGLTRSVYNRSSVSTHTSTSRSEVGRIHAWVRVVLCELLEIPH
jgi:hypothetical protein